MEKYRKEIRLQFRNNFFFSETFLKLLLEKKKKLIFVWEDEDVNVDKNVLGPLHSNGAKFFLPSMSRKKGVNLFSLFSFFETIRIRTLDTFR